MQNCGGRNKVHYGQCENSEFQTFGRFYALRCNLRSAKFLDHVRTHLAEPVHVRFTQYKNGVICTLWGYHLRGLLAGVISRRVSAREAHLLARFAETKLLKDTHMDTREGWCS